MCGCAAGGSSEPGNTADLEVLQKRVRRQETLLQRCKELINTNKERSAQLSSENDALQQQLQERLQELEKIKVCIYLPGVLMELYSSKSYEIKSLNRVQKKHYYT